MNVYLALPSDCTGGNPNGCSGDWPENTQSTLSGFIQVSLSKIQGLFKDFSKLFYSFQGPKF